MNKLSSSLDCNRAPASLEEEWLEQQTESLWEDQWNSALNQRAHLMDPRNLRGICKRRSLSLGAGANLGFVHLGVLDILDRVMGAGWTTRQFRCFVGASIGSLIAYYLYAHCPPRLIVHRLLPMFMNRELRKQFSTWRAIARGGLIHLDQFEGVVREFLVQLNLDPMLTLQEAHERYGEAASCAGQDHAEGDDSKCKGEEEGCSVQGRTFACAVANLSRNCTEYLDHRTHPNLRVARALAISMAYPILVSLCPLRGEEFTDGGMYGMVPFGYTHPKDTFALHAGYSTEPRVAPGKVAHYSLPEMLGVIFSSINSYVTKEQNNKAHRNGTILFEVPASCEEGMFEISMPERRRLVHVGRTYMVLILLLANTIRRCLEHFWYQVPSSLATQS